MKINKANDEEKARFNAGDIGDAESTIHAQAKRIFRDMENGVCQANRETRPTNRLCLTMYRRAESNCSVGSFQRFIDQKAGGDVQDAEHTF